MRSLGKSLSKLLENYLQNLEHQTREATQIGPMSNMPQYRKQALTIQIEIRNKSKSF